MINRVTVTSEIPAHLTVELRDEVKPGIHVSTLVYTKSFESFGMDRLRYSIHAVSSEVRRLFCCCTEVTRVAMGLTQTHSNAGCRCASGWTHRDWTTSPRLAVLKVRELELSPWLFTGFWEEKLCQLKCSLTNRRCTYPQELFLRLDRVTKLQQIQLLSHEYKVVCLC